MDNLTAWLLFQQAFGFGTSRGQKVLDRLGHPAGFFSLPLPEQQELLQLTLAERRRMQEITPRRVEAIQKTCENLRCTILTPEHPQYPQRLGHIYAPPAVLYARGSLEGLDDTLCIAMVGTRRCTDYGRQAAARLAGELAQAGVTIISGMALGIDTVCHQAALVASGRTVAVWGTGIDQVYPTSNSALAESILEFDGALLTEFPPGSGPMPFHFPIRNRIVSGLSQGTVVVEGTQRSGSLITAGHALTQDRDVFAVPGDIFSPMSQAPNWLISEGATMVRDVQDILDQYRHLIAKKPPTSAKKIRYTPDKPSPEGHAVPKKEQAALAQTKLDLGLTDVQNQLYQLLDGSPQTSDQLVKDSGLGVGMVLATLTQLEIFGLVQVHPGRRFSRS